MSIHIIITRQAVGRARLYASVGKQSRYRLIPTYKCILVSLITKERFTFAITRDASPVVFEGRVNNRYARNCECPPSRPGEPYRARVHYYPADALALKLFEKDDHAQENVRGIGTVVRSHIMLHSGPGCSLGCMMIAGGKKGHHKFAHAVEKMLRGGHRIEVTIKPIHR